MKKIFRTIDSMEIKGSDRDKAEFGRYKDEVKQAISEMDYRARKLLRQLDKHHSNTIKHNVMVAHDVKYIAQSLGLNEEDVQSLFVAALLHDVGKIDVLDILLDSTKEAEQEMLEIKRKENPSDFRLKAKNVIPVDVLTVNDLLKYNAGKKGFDMKKVKLILKEKGVSLRCTLRKYLSSHQERTKKILTDIGVDPKLVHYAANHHPEYFTKDARLDWRCHIISIADKFNAIIQSEGIRYYTTRKNRIRALDIVIECIKSRMAKFVFDRKPKKIIRIIGKKYVPLEIEHFLIPYAESIIAALRTDRRLSVQRLKEIADIITDIEVTFEVNEKVKYILDDSVIKKLKDIESELESIVQYDAKAA